MSAELDERRPRLLGIAYRMLGSISDAEDVVQDAWLRWQRLGPQGQASILNLDAWFTTVVTRLSLDQLSSARRQREQYVGPWLPEPLVEPDVHGGGSHLGPDPADAAVLSESLTLGFLCVLDRLAPTERAVFLLVEVFGEPYSTVAAVVDRSEATCRQIARRARQRVRSDRHVDDVPTDPRPLLEAFLAAVVNGDLDGLTALLADDVVLTSDGGGRVAAAVRPVRGDTRVARFLVNLARRATPSTTVRWCRVNGELGIEVLDGDRRDLVMGVDLVGEAIGSIRMVRNPDKVSATLSSDELA